MTSIEKKNFKNRANVKVLKIIHVFYYVLKLGARTNKILSKC